MPKIIQDELVYQATIDEILANGYTGTTMKRIAQCADVSALTLFRKYESKAKLVVRAVEANLQGMENEIGAFTGDISADLLRVIQVFSQISPQQHGLFGLILLELSRYPELEEVLTIPSTIIRAAGNLIEQYQAIGILRKDLQASQIVQILLGPITIHPLIRQADSVISILPLAPKEYVDQFLYGHLQRGMSSSA